MAAVFTVADPAVRHHPDAVALSRVRDMMERTKLMFMNDALSDANLLVGRESSPKTSIPVHSIFLRSCSEVFAAMFSSDWQKSQSIPIPEFEASPVISLLRWTYCSELVFESDQFYDVLRAAHFFMVTPLVDYVLNHFDAFAGGHIWSMYDYSTLHDNQELEAKCLQFVGHQSQAKSQDTIMQDDFMNVSVATITSLVSDGKVLIDETILFSRCLLWAKAECERRQQEATPEHLSNAMSPFIEQFAFPSMKATEFAGLPCESGVLSYEDQALVLRSIIMEDLPTRFRKEREGRPKQGTKTSFVDTTSQEKKWPSTSASNVGRKCVPSACTSTRVVMFMLP